MQQVVGVREWILDNAAISGVASLLEEEDANMGLLQRTTPSSDRPRRISIPSSRR